jgi:hypothetical protein
MKVFEKIFYELKEIHFELTMLRLILASIDRELTYQTGNKEET